VGAVVLLAVMASLPYFWAAREEANLAETRSELAFLQKKRESRATSGTSQVSADDDTSSMLLSGNTAGLASAAFQTKVSGLAAENNLTLSRMSSLLSEPRGALQSVKLDISATGEIENLRSFLVALEGTSPFMFVRDAKVSKAVTKDDSQSRTLEINLRLEAFADGGKEK
jgi:hypothetical protein